MALITDNAAPVFDMEQVHKGDLVRAKHITWDSDDYRNGVVVSLSPEKMVVIYFTGYGNISNHFIVYASEVSAKEWDVKWTTDMETINSTEEEQGEGAESQESDNDA